MAEETFYWRSAVAKLLQKNPGTVMSPDDIIKHLFRIYPNHWRNKRAQYTKKYTDAEFHTKERSILTSVYTWKNRDVITALYPKIELITTNNKTKTLQAMVWREDKVESKDSHFQQTTADNTFSLAVDPEIYAKIIQMQHSIPYILECCYSVKRSNEQIKRKLIWGRVIQTIMLILLLITMGISYYV